MTMGRAYTDILSPHVQEALEIGCNWIIDHCFDGYHEAKDPERFEQSILGEHLPQRYLQKYTPLFFKQLIHGLCDYGGLEVSTAAFSASFFRCKGIGRLGHYSCSKNSDG